MFGLLDDEFYDDPQRMALMSAGAGLLSQGDANGRAMAGMFGGLVKGGQQAQLNKQRKLELELERQYRQEQIDMMRLKEKRESGRFDMQQEVYRGLLPSAGPVPQAGTAPQAGATPGFTPPSGRGGEAMALDRLRAAAIAGIPGAEQLFNIHKYENDPFKMEAGSTYLNRRTGEERHMPKLNDGLTMNNGQVSVAPNYAEANASIKAAEQNAIERAKAGYDPLPTSYVGADGVPIGGTREQYVKGSQQQGFGGFDPSKLTPAQHDYLRKTQPEAYANGLTSFNATRGASPRLQSEADKKEQLGQIDLRQGATADLNKNWVANSYNPTLQAGKEASNMRNSLDTLAGVDINTGWATEGKALAANVLVGLGIDSANANMYATNAQKFQVVAMEKLWSTLNEAKGPQTEGDADRARQTFIQLKNTPEANKYIVAVARAKANRDARKAQFYQEALPLAQREGDLNKVDREWAKIQGSIWDDPALQPYKGKK